MAEVEEKREMTKRNRTRSKEQLRTERTAVCKEINANKLISIDLAKKYYYYVIKMIKRQINVHNFGCRIGEPPTKIYLPLKRKKKEEKKLNKFKLGKTKSYHIRPAANNVINCK